MVRLFAGGIAQEAAKWAPGNEYFVLKNDFLRSTKFKI